MTMTADMAAADISALRECTAALEANREHLVTKGDLYRAMLYQTLTIITTQSVIMAAMLRIAIN